MEVLRHQLDELLRQNIIAPVDELENVPLRTPKYLKHRCKLTFMTEEVGDLFDQRGRC